ncbi:AAA family ATPase [Cardinium endosymbiont of Culicoides punctatus]|uniref:AAA family ATPase n=1 Tax=Cardinium endosymbiont of Culicoides punctatus TaxID=2304601 RepID=UPI0014043BD3|nr:AAA family ATPase [Cardinium endosymbiont of Culicoides punctatus]
MHQDPKDLENKRPLEEVEIGSDSKRQKYGYDNIPIGVVSIEEMLSTQYYVDKTNHAYTLMSGVNKFIFLSRPRRFGKSLFVSTLEEIAKGNKELFQDCYIYNSGYDWKKYPVIRVDFSKVDNDDSELLKHTLINRLYDIACEYDVKIDIPTEKNPIKDYTINLINKLYSKFIELKKTDESYEPKIVVLVDEYDAPFINQSDPVIKESNRLIVRDFLGVIKSLSIDNKIKLEFVTGVSAYCFKECNSGPNNLDDITLDQDYATIAGYREKEDLLQEGSAYYKRIKELAEEQELDTNTIISHMRSKYNGYKFATHKNTISVYNPWSTLKFLKHGILNNYWYNTGTPTFLTKRVDDSYFNIDFSQNIITTEYKLTSPKENELNMVGKMFQSGYLTIDKYEPPLKKGELASDTKPLLVTFPNDEVKESFYNSLSEEIEESLKSKGRDSEDNVRNSLINVDIDGFISTLESSFSSIPYFLFLQEQNKNEAFYHSVLHAFLRGAKLNPESEKCSNLGRIDIVINSIPSLTYIFELKHGQDANTALKQTENTKYIQQYIRQNKDIVVIGINFDSEDRNLNDYECKYYDSKGNEIPDRDAFLDHIGNRKKNRNRVNRQRG